MMKKVLLSCIVLFVVQLAFSQTQHNPFYDYRKGFHFGFTLGTNFADVKYNFADDFYRNDTLNRVDIEHPPGITLGPIVNLHLRERLDLRSMPSLLLSQRNILYTFNDGTQERKDIESVYIDIPVLIKYKSTRHQNLRFYVVGGGKYSYDIAAKEGRVKDPFDPNVSLRRNNYFWIYGCGLDMYFKYFKFSPEIRVCNGINNVLDPHPTVFTSSFDKIRTRLVMITFHFE